MNEPKFKVGDIVRYSAGPTAIMTIQHVSKDHAGLGLHRYYGRQYYGGSVGAYEKDCILVENQESKNE